MTGIDGMCNYKSGSHCDSSEQKVHVVEALSRSRAGDIHDTTLLKIMLQFYPLFLYFEIIALLFL